MGKEFTSIEYDAKSPHPLPPMQDHLWEESSSTTEFLMKNCLGWDKLPYLVNYPFNSPCACGHQGRRAPLSLVSPLQVVHNFLSPESETSPPPLLRLSRLSLLTQWEARSGQGWCMQDFFQPSIIIGHSSTPLCHHQFSITLKATVETGVAV